MATPCAPNPPPPDGYRVWRKPVPQELANWAVYLLKNELPKAAYGTQWSTWYTPPNGSPIAVEARRDHHTWTHDKQGRLITNICIPGVTLYEPIPTAAFTSYNSAADTLDTPDSSAAMFNDGPPGPNWGLVAASGAAGLAVVGLFFLALRKI